MMCLMTKFVVSYVSSFPCILTNPLTSILTLKGMSTRFGKYTISVWTKHGNDKDAKDKIFKRLRKIFLTPNLPFDYKIHDVSINIVKRNLDKGMPNRFNFMIVDFPSLLFSLF